MKIENVNTEVYHEVLARDEMDEETFNAMMECGLNEAMRGKTRMASDVFKDIRPGIGCLEASRRLLTKSRRKTQRTAVSA